MRGRCPFLTGVENTGPQVEYYDTEIGSEDDFRVLWGWHLYLGQARDIYLCVYEVFKF
jgi:hypothetical protein